MEEPIFVQTPTARLETCFHGHRHSNKLAIISHPLAFLGGSFNDHVIIGTTDLCLSLDYAVVRVNSRGAGKSTGRGSWSCLPEAEDFQAIIDHFVSCHPIPLEQLLLIGYSAGSLSVIKSTNPSNLPSTCRVRRILIGFPLSALWALTCFHSSPFTTAMNRHLEAHSEILAVQGTRDEFTSSSKYKTWAGTCHEKNDLFRAVHIEKADHFWLMGYREPLLSEIRQWISL